MIAKIPFETEFLVKEICFKCSFINVILTDKPFVDNYIVNELSKEYELKNEKGEIEATKHLFELKLGFNTKLKEGSYYVIPNIFNYYYCDKIENDMVSLILIESYQHGKLLQAMIKQKIENCVHYIEVEEKNKINKLKLLHHKYISLKSKNK